VVPVQWYYRQTAVPGLRINGRKGSTNISGATNMQYSATKAANYKVIVTNSNGCTKASTNAKVTKSCLPIASNGDIASAAITVPAELLLYPNPSKGRLTGEYTSRDNSRKELHIYDITGRPVYTSHPYFIKGKNVFNLNLSHFSSGSYYIELKGGNKLNRIKFIIEK